MESKDYCGAYFLNFFKRESNLKGIWKLERNTVIDNSFL